jgi:PAS domain-containing protein
MRFTETEYSANPSQFDFVPRGRRGQITHVIVAFVICIAIIFITSLVGDANILSTLLSMVLISCLCFYVVYRKQQNLDLVMSTEYQNMLFAQAATLGSSFSMFVRRDGTIVYADNGLRELFPDSAYSDSLALERVFEGGGVNKADRERIMGAIYNLHSDRLVFPIKHQTGEEHEYILTVEPLARPGNFLLVRGRQYRDQRAGLQLLPDILRSTSADKLDHMLATTPIAHYITDEFGRFEYVNPAFEKLLGYPGGEMVGSKLSLHHVLYQLNGQPVGGDYTLSDFSGNALIQKKQSDLVDASLHQATLRDASGKVAGASGSIVAAGDGA